MLRTEEVHKLGLSKNVCEVCNNFGIKTVLTSYNKTISLKKIQEEFAEQDKMLVGRNVK